MRRVDHQPVGLARLRRQCREDVREHAEPAPADEVVVEGLMRTVGAWRILPLQAIADHVDDTAASRPSTSHALALIQPGGAMRDHELIAAADEAGLARVFSGVRQFRH